MGRTRCLLTLICAMDLGLSKAERAIMAAKEAASQIGVKFSFAVMDSGVNLVAFARMDGCPVGCNDVAIKKARTAALFRKESAELGKKTLPGQPVYGLEHSNGGLITFPGGVPLRNASGDFIGSIGVSGGSVEEDLVVARAAAKVVAELN